MPVPTEACGQCLRRPPPLHATRAAFVYGPPLDRLLPRLKFHDDLAAGRLLAALMAEAWAADAASLVDRMADPSTDLMTDRTDIAEVQASGSLGGSTPNPETAAAQPLFDAGNHRSRPDALIPLPLHPRRLRARGYDQALELARPLAQRFGLPLRTDLLTRVRDTAPQSRLDAPARRKNLRRAFAVHRTALARTPLKHVVLIDDVMTTGATLHAAAEALLRAGVERVDAWVCARVE
jgi:predicted amidophosphoribosyltransferase